MNIILLLSDTFRYDNLFDRAAMPVRTPCLDEFSRRAVSMERFFTGSFPTIPQRTDMTSGRYGWPWYPWQPLAKSTKNHMPSLFAKQGYVTQLICDCPHLFNSGFQHGFHAAYATRGQEGDLYFLRMNREIAGVMPPAKTRAGRHFQGRNLVDLHRWQNSSWRVEEDRFPARTARLAVEWLEENYRHHPFFLWVDFFDPHEPWDPPEYMVRKYDPDYRGVPMLHPNYGKAGDLTRSELRNLRAHYCAEAELVDRWIGRVLQKIDDLDMWKNTVVVFTTDHGISLGEHNRTGKSNINDGDQRMWPVYPEIAHIPFMAAAPGLKGGRKVSAFAQPVDILPTLAELAGVRIEPPEPLHGRSFAAALRGRRFRREAMAVCGCFMRLKPEGALPPRAVTPVLYTERWAYAPIGARGKRELYDLKRDPCAENDVSRAHPDVTARLHQEFKRWLEGLQAPQEALQVFCR